jgi:hypothetical protein
MTDGQRASLVRGRFLLEKTNWFAILLIHELEIHGKRVAATGRTLVPRLNGTSDMPWWLLAPDLFKHFHEYQFQDYTKDDVAVISRFLPDNYYLVQSAHEKTTVDWLRQTQVDVAVAFAVRKGQALPAVWHGKRVIDGDLHDLRFLDRTLARTRFPIIVGLRAKGNDIDLSSPFFHMV